MQVTYIDCKAAAKLCPSNPDAQAIMRWARIGLKARTGDRIRLKHVRSGQRVYTTAEWVHEFMLKLAQVDAMVADEPCPPAPRVIETKSARRRREVAAAMKALAAL